METTTLDFQVQKLFSIGSGAVVLSYRAVKILAQAYSSPGCLHSNRVTTTTEDTSQGVDTTPPSGGSLALKSLSRKHNARASSIPGQRVRAAACRRRHKDGARKYRPASADSGWISKETHVCSYLSSTTTAFPRLPQFPSTNRERRCCATRARGKKMSPTSTEVSLSKSLSTKALANYALLSSASSKTRAGHTSLHEQAFAYTSSGFIHSRCDFRREGKAESRELLAFPAAVSFPTEGRIRRSSTTLTKAFAGCDRAHASPAGSRENNFSAISERRHTAVRSTDDPRSSSVVEEASKSVFEPVHGRKEEDGLRGQLHFSPSSLEQLHDFLAAAFRAARSSLYVCLPIHPTALSFGCTYTPSRPVSSIHRDTDDNSDEVHVKACAVDDVFPLKASDTDCRTYEKDTAHVWSSGDTAESPCASVAASAYAATRKKKAFSSSSSLQTRESKSTDAAGAAEDDSLAPASVVAPLTVCRHLSAASSSAPSCAAAFSTCATYVDAAPVFKRSTSPLVPFSIAYDSRQKQAQSIPFEATAHRNVLCCACTKVDTSHPVLTPTCLMFRIIQHLYAFLTSCSAAFTPFAAEVYVVPVWVDVAAGGVLAAYSDAAGGRARQVKKKTLAKVSRTADESIVASATEAASVEYAPPPASDSPAGDGREAAEARKFSHARRARAAVAARPSVSLSSREELAANKVDRGWCKWQKRLLQTLQNHCQSSATMSSVTREKLVNIVDAKFEITDRSFAVSCALHKLSYSQNYARQTDKLHFQSEGPSTLKVHTAPVTIVVGDATHLATGGTDVAALAASAAAAYATEKEAARTASKGIAGASLLTTERTTEPEDARGAGAGATCLTVEKRGNSAGNAAEWGDADARREKDTEGVRPATARAAEDTEVNIEPPAAEQRLPNEAAAGGGQQGSGLADRASVQFKPAVRGFPHVIVAGTFDRLHAGHKLLLTVATLLSTERLGIGCTAGILVEKKACGGEAAEAAAAVQTFALRAQAAAAFVALIATAARAGQFVAPPRPAANKGEFALAAVRVAVAAVSRGGAAASTRCGAAAGAAAAEVTEGNAAFKKDKAFDGDTLAEEEGRPPVPAPTAVNVECHIPREARARGGAAAVEKQQISSLAGSPEGAHMSRYSSSAAVCYPNYCQVVLGDEMRRESVTRRSSSAGDARKSELLEGTSVAGGDEGGSSAQQHVYKEEGEIEAAELRWRKLIYEALAETKRTGGTPDVAQMPKFTPTDSSITEAVGRRAANNCPSAEPTNSKLAIHTDTRLSENIFLPVAERVLPLWTGCIMPPQFSYRENVLPLCTESSAAGGDRPDHPLSSPVVENNTEQGPGLAVVTRLSSTTAATPLPRASTVPFRAELCSFSAALSAASTTSPHSADYFAMPASATCPLERRASIRRSASLSDIPKCPAAVARSGGTPRHRDGRYRSSGAPLTRISASFQGISLHSTASSKRSKTFLKPSIDVYIMPIEDRLGPAGDMNFDALVVSAESFAGGLYVNQERLKRSRAPVWLVEVPALSAASVQLASAVSSRCDAIWDEHVTNFTNRKGTVPSKAPARSATASASSFLDKVSSSELRLQQKARLQDRADMALLRRGFAAAVDVLLQGTAPVWKMYWSLLCSLYVAPWRRLFTVERLARLLSRIDIVKQRTEADCWDGTCYAVTVLSLWFAYAVHNPLGLYACALSSGSTAVEAHSYFEIGGALSKKVSRRPGKCIFHPLHACRLEETWNHFPGIPAHMMRLIEVEHQLRGGDRLDSGTQHLVEEKATISNERLVHGFLQDVAVFNQLRTHCARAAFAEQRRLSEAVIDGSTLDPQRATEDAPQNRIHRSYSCEGDPPQSNASVPCAGLGTLYALILCIRTARQTCAFLLPCLLISTYWQLKKNSVAWSRLTEEKRPVHSAAMGEELYLGGNVCRMRRCLGEQARNSSHSEAEPSGKYMPNHMHQVKNRCCRVVRLLELLELALPEELYDVCARRMREEYYHMCDYHYAQYRRLHLQCLQLQLAGDVSGLTEAELILIRRNLLREERGLAGDDKRRCMEECSSPKYAYCTQSTGTSAQPLHG